MFNILKNLIKHKFYSTSEEILMIIQTFCENHKLTEEESITLTEMVSEFYPSEVVTE